MSKHVLVKLGGSVITDVNYRKSIISQLVELKKKGFAVTIVHGGGKLISKNMDIFGIEPKFYEGLRITPAEAVDVVMMTLVGKVNKDIVKDFNEFSVSAIGLCGGDGQLIQCKKLEKPQNVDLGFVGVPVKTNVDLINNLLNLDYVLVIATIGSGDDGYYNINADHTAAFIAKELKVDHLIYVSDVDGVINPGTQEVFSQLSREYIDILKEKGIITAGMLPKLASCLEAFENGVSNVCIINGKKDNSIYDALVNGHIKGTEII